MSLCFDGAYQALEKKQITEEQYLHEVLLHFCGTRHPADARPQRVWESMVKDPIGNAIREAALKSPQTRPEVLGQLERLFASTLKDDASAVRSIVSQLQGESGQSVPLQAIATFAALHNDSEVLRLCLQIGASLGDRNTQMALEYAARGPALLDLLFEHNWRGMRTSRIAFDKVVEWSLHTGPEELKWFLDHGAIVDKRTIRRLVHGSLVKAACVKLLLD